MGLAVAGAVIVALILTIASNSYLAGFLPCFRRRIWISTISSWFIIGPIMSVWTYPPVCIRQETYDNDDGRYATVVICTLTAGWQLARVDNSLPHHTRPARLDSGSLIVVALLSILAYTFLNQPISCAHGTA